MERYPFVRDALQAAVPRGRCPGSELDESYTPDDVTYHHSEGKALYARVTCPPCGQTFTVAIVYSRNGIPLGPEGVVVVPRHPPRDLLSTSCRA